jgi:hypothetical protein
MVLAPPFGDAFDFRNTHLTHTFCSLLTFFPVVDLKSYPDAVFTGCVAVGVFIIRQQRKRINAERPEFKAWDVVLLFYIAIQIILLVMPVIISPLFQTELSLIQNLSVGSSRRWNLCWKCQLLLCNVLPYWYWNVGLLQLSILIFY